LRGDDQEGTQDSENLLSCSCSIAAIRDDHRQSRICIPEFFRLYTPPPSISAGTCSGASYNDSVGTCAGGGYEPPSAEFIIMARGADLEKNMRKTIDSDPRLKQMADHLGGLYYEMRSVQDRFMAMKRANRKPVIPYKGPRSL
jgi:hypothetical protein